MTTTLTFRTEQRYFTLLEIGGENRNIGTVVVDIIISTLPAYHLTNRVAANEQFNNSISRALCEHFDQECKLLNPVDIVDYLDAEAKDVPFTFPEDGETRTELFEISSTWLY